MHGLYVLGGWGKEWHMHSSYLFVHEMYGLLQAQLVTLSHTVPLCILSHFIAQFILPFHSPHPFLRQ